MIKLPFVSRHNYEVLEGLNEVIVAQSERTILENQELVYAGYDKDDEINILKNTHAIISKELRNYKIYGLPIAVFFGCIVGYLGR